MSVQNITAGYGSVDVLMNVNFDIHERRTVAVVGESGLEKLVENAGGNESAAAVGILENLTAAPAGKESNVIWVSYRNGDPGLARDVLKALVDEYYEASGNRADHYFDKEWTAGEAPNSRLVVIGLHGLEQEKITKQIRALMG